ncbi:hypothetical protein Sjap_026073 [Stephania japonica]|uniref:Uncharacterized protein n=1 Tax=Stephania japonica TaxID=461633 RepID=A0AAP0HI56_9MAGN
MDSKSVKAISLFVLLFFVILLSTPGEFAFDDDAEAAETQMERDTCLMTMKSYGLCWFNYKCDRYCKSSLDTAISGVCSSFSCVCIYRCKTP